MSNQRERDLAAVMPYIHEWHLSGSTAIHGIGADYDVVALVPDMAVLTAELVKLSWTLCGTQYESVRKFQAFRLEEINLIATEDAGHYGRWKVALQVALILKASGCALNKEERAKLFNLIKGLS